MPLTKEISGYKNEEEFARYLNHSVITELHPIMTELLYQLYGDIGK